MEYLHNIGIIYAQNRILTIGIMVDAKYTHCA